MLHPGGMQQQPMTHPGFMQQQSTNNTTVVLQQQPQQIMIQGERDWSTGLCSCCDDCGICCFAYCCPAIHSCVVASLAKECCCVGMYCPFALRTKIRLRHNIKGSICEDFCVLAWCGSCAMCQMHRELNIHGI
ncbi:cornifelin homolog A-like [Xenia sp. Carnegie-2017]|uniref:cornifelin homolog A-like n=1 Tax=Xenia sp. Carnegie-2017 TaxID=2897299 RepID=UPI001F034426|nr:cornifelin homolog A-like [Xenia sp. Carnegie-2017]